MSSQKRIPNSLLWIAERLGILLPIAFLTPILLLVAFGYLLDQRIGNVEEQLNYQPPREFKEIDIDDFETPTADVLVENPTQRIYVPVYSHIYFRRGAPYSLEATLSIRNIDPEDSIVLHAVEYFDTDGVLVKQHLPAPILLQSLQTVEFLVEEHDSSGGSGANFLVTWSSKPDVDVPLTECVMVGSNGTHAISLSRAGVEVGE